jgi:RNA polymerase-binding transcription factor DksA
MTIDFDSARSGLVTEREKLVRQMGELGASEDGDLRPDLDFGEGFADAAAITAERTEVLGLVEALKERLDAVDAAIARIDDGSYGVCKTCGGQIPAARMEARPESVQCVDCKSKRP